MKPLKGPILIIEDSDEDQDIIREVLNQLELQDCAVMLNNGADALHYLRARPQPFIILCDINMPKMNGLQLRREINDDEYLRKKSIPFIFFSTAANPADVHLAYDLTVQGFFKKASRVKELKEQLRLIIEYWLSCRHPNN